MPEPTPGYPSRRRRTTNLGLAALSGLVYAAAFPPFDRGDLAFLCLVPLLVALATVPPRTGLLLGWISGTVATLLLVAPSIFVAVRSAFDGSTGIATLASLLIPQVYGALWFALFGLGASVLLAARPLRPTTALLVAAWWAGLELARSRFGSGCPWVLLGHAVVLRPAWIQGAAVGGVPAVSFVVAYVNLIIAFLVASRRGVAVFPGSLGVMATVASVWWFAGWTTLDAPLPAAQPLRVALVQTAVPADWRLSIRHQGEVLTRLREITARAAASDPQLVVWPENALAVSPAANPEPVERLLREVAPRAFLLASGPRAVTVAIGRAEIRNSVLAFAPGGAVVATYDKMRLTPFGEQSPLPTLPLVGEIVAAATPYTPGPAAVAIEVDGRRLATPICLELIYPELVRAQVRDGAQLLVNLSNDDWFGDTAAVEQHFRAGLMRAVETGRWLVRATTSGVTAVVDPRGRVVARLPRHEAEALAAEVALLRGETPYVRAGDLFGWAALLVAGFAVARGLRRNG